MKVHEHQAKEVLANYDLPIPDFGIAHTPEEAEEIAGRFGATVVKAQVHVGGRGKAGGVKLADTPEEAREHTEAILGMEIKGLPVEKVMVTKQVDIAEEIYAGVTLDRDARRLVLIVSAAGGVDIEQVAEETPEKIAEVNIDPRVGLQDYQIREVLYNSGVNRDKIRDISGVIKKLYQCYVEHDCGLVEINPLVITEGGEVSCVDAKMDFDDNALYRHPALEDYREVGADLDEIEKYAVENDVTYVHMPEDQRGRVGIMGNGAGLVMTTLDVVAREGEQPNNFLDVGGGSGAEAVEKALDTILRDDEVEVLFVNIFAGISRCDQVARGLVDGVQEIDKDLPIVVRMTGTNETEGRRILEEEGGDRFITARTMEEGAKKAVQLVQGQATA